MNEHRRPETGAMQFGDDWPGVFIRGDSAFGYGLALQGAEAALEREGNLFTAAQIRGLAALLFSCDARRNPTPQMVKPEALSSPSEQEEVR